MPQFLVIGSGLAGLTFALRAAAHGEVTVLTKAEVTDANTSYAQGGIAAAVGEADSWELHERDTLTAGAGLCDPEAVRFLVRQAPDAIDWLTSLGASFDLESDGDFALGREGGHSRNRILHKGDRTGWEIENKVVAAVRNSPKIRIIEHAFVFSLLMDGDRCVGAAAHLPDLGVRTFIGDAVMVATGGAGMLYQHSTNPRVATADGIGLALQVRARVEGLEFMQFHPTTLYHPQSRSFLITEATRGVGATLRTHRGTRFMYDYDERLELAPRDVVSRSMVREMKRLETWCLYLDLAHLDGDKITHEFPHIASKLLEIGIDMRKDWIPVVPAQHYSCGGIRTDLSGKTSISGLYAAGEVASTGVHGANRLASNSLLEAVVFASSAAADCKNQAEVSSVNVPTPELPRCPTETDSVSIRKILQSTMTDHLGIIRTNNGLATAEKTVRRLLREFNAKSTHSFSEYGQETRHLLVAAQALIETAIGRKENIGLHFNEDQA